MHIMNFMTTFYNKDFAQGRRINFPYHIFQISFLRALPILGLLLLVACEEDPTTIGSGILPGTDFNTISASDTFTIESYTSYIDTISSMQPTYSYLGSIMDPYFGRTDGGFATQLWLYYPWPQDDDHIDSLTLYLYVYDTIGDITVGQNINIYEIDEYMHLDSTYYTSREVPKKQLLASIPYNGLDVSSGVVTIPLPLSFADELLRDPEKVFLGTDTIDFRNAFNGLYFEYPQTDNFHMLGIDLLGGVSNLTIHYTDTLGSDRDFIFIFNTKAVYYNTYNHDYDAAEPGKGIEHINDSFLDTITFIQGFNGVYTTIRIPGLEQLRDSISFGVNKARLYMPAYVNETDFIVDAVPQSLIGRYVDSDGERYLLTDYSLSSDFFDGKFYELEERYLLNITNFVQDYLKGLIDEPEIELIIPGYSSDGGILWANNGGFSPRFELVLTNTGQ